MKYWRGYLTAAILGFFSWALMEFAKTHTELVDMFYPYVTRMIQNTLAQWSGTMDGLLWQVLLVLLFVVVLATVTLMIIFRWNPIQWLGWVLAVASVVGLLNTGVYGLNIYAGSIADDLNLSMSEYTIDQLEDAAVFYRDKANDLAASVNRDSNGDVVCPEFDQLADLASDGFQRMTYVNHEPIFYGTAIAVDDYWANWEALPIKELGWTDYFTSVGVTSIHMPLTGEIAINTQVPAIAQPFIVCREMAKRLCIAAEGDAEFAAYLACKANEDPAFQYSAALMAYRSCRDALASLPGYVASAALKNVEAGVNDDLRRDLEVYEKFFTENASPENLERVETVNNFMDDLTYNLMDLFGVEPDNRETDAFYDLLVNWHIQEVVLPTKEPEEEEIKFDPYNEDYINGITDMAGNQITDPESTEETTGE